MKLRQRWNQRHTNFLKPKPKPNAAHTWRMLVGTWGDGKCIYCPAQCYVEYGR